MSLARRLARLGPLPGAAPAPAGGAVAPVTPTPPAPSPPPGGPDLDALRAKMDAILRRAPAPPRPPPAPSAYDELPFAVEETPLGPLHVRTLRLDATARTGRVPAFTARRASSELLALLALDPSLAVVDLGRALYLDTETTGLSSGAGTVAFLVGLAFFDAHGLVLEQLLVRRLGEEAALLARVEQRCREASCFVSFNGKSFDLPVLRTRFVLGGRTLPEAVPHLDLLHVARRVHGRGPRSARARVGAPAGGRGSTTLGGLERDVLGFHREDDVPSGEVSAVYLHFLRSGDPTMLLKVVDHNAWDVLTMVSLVGLYGEPFDEGGLAPADLAEVARTLARAGDLERAHDAASLSVARGALEGRLARAEVAKARRDLRAALADFEVLAEGAPTNAVRLELAKLYEHHVRSPGRALALARAGTGERDDAFARRVTRLEDKLAKAAAAEAARAAKAAAKASAKAAKAAKAATKTPAADGGGTGNLW